MRAKLFFSTLIIPAFLAAPAMAGKSDDPVLVKKNFSSAPETVAPVRGKGSDNIFGSLFGNKKKIIIEDALDLPEVSSANPDAGFEVYKPEKLLPLADEKLSGASLFVPLSGNVLDALRDPALPITLRAAEKEAVLNFYVGRSFAPVWVSREEGFTPRARALLEKLAAAEEEGLEPRDYLPPGLESFSDDGSAFSNDDAALARADVAITAMAARYARELAQGRVIPKRLSGYYDIDPPAADLGAALESVAKADDPAAALALLAPAHPAYAAMRAELARERELLAAEVAPFPEGPRVKPGQKDIRIPILRERLEREGFLKERPASWTNQALADAALDQPLSDALKAFQKNAGIKATGALDQATMDAMNGAGARANVERLALNMERLRWLPRDLGERYVFVNQAAFELTVMNKGAEEWRTRVIVGKPNTQTLVFSDEMELAIFNPTWGVPQSIIVKEMLPELQRDPSYLDKKGFQVTDNKGNVIPSEDIDWSSFSKAVPLNVVQPAGDDNALGEVKFLFPNTHNIYMHDTPTRKLFNDTVRAYSHGCVRVQNPRKFAEVLLGWDEQKVADAIASGRSQSVRLEQKIPVYLQYFTAWPGADGRMTYFADVYGRDQRLQNAFGTLVQLAENNTAP